MNLLALQSALTASDPGRNRQSDPGAGEFWRRTAWRHPIVAIACLFLAGPAAVIAQTRPSDLRVTPVVLAYRRAKPAVVNISTTKLVRVRHGFFGPDIFEDFFPSLSARKVPVQSLGSGFLINPAGYIVTNAHVVRQAEEITVTLTDGAKYPAEAISSDSDYDLAVLRITPKASADFPYLPLARSDDLMVGETVIAIGNPLGYANTLTTGVISAIDRTLTLRDDLEIRGLIQTDAPINRGNSGGPLLNIKGELIGINTAIRADAQNIGFAIPVDRLTAELPGLLDAERINRTVFGVSVEQARTKEGDRLRVSAVHKGTPAEGKLEVGDIVVELNGLPMKQISDYACAMVAANPSSEMFLKVIRRGRQMAVSVTPEPKPKPDGKSLARKHFGISLKVLTPPIARELGLWVARGLLVIAVEPNSPARELGIEPADVLYQVGRLYVTDFDTLGTVLEDLKPSQAVTIGIIRGNTRALVSINTRRLKDD